MSDEDERRRRVAQIVARKAAEREVAEHKVAALDREKAMLAASQSTAESSARSAEEAREANRIANCANDIAVEALDLARAANSIAENASAKAKTANRIATIAIAATMLVGIMAALLA